MPEIPQHGGDSSEMRRHTSETGASYAAKRALRIARWLGGFALTWLCLALGLILYGGILLSREETTRDSVLIAVALAGSAGATTAGTTQLTSLIARSKYQAKWTGYFLANPFLGATVALFAYFTVVGGLVERHAIPEGLNVYGVLALGFISGAFSRQLLSAVGSLGDHILGRAPYQMTARRKRAPDYSLEVTSIDRYRGYLVANLAREKGDSWRADLHFSPTQGAANSSREFDFGSGYQPPIVKLRATVLVHNAEKVEPPSVDLTAFRDSEGTRATFRFEGIGSAEPSIVLEISNRGRSVGMMTLSSSEAR